MQKQPPGRDVFSSRVQDGVLCCCWSCVSWSGLYICVSNDILQMEQMAVLSSTEKSVYFQIANEVILGIGTYLSMVSWTKEIMIFILSYIQSPFCSKMPKPHRMGYHIWFAGFDFRISYIFYYQSVTSMQSETEPYKIIIIPQTILTPSSQIYCLYWFGLIYLAVL